MLVFFKHQLVLLSVPKTGTTALQQALGTLADLVISGPPALKHAPLYRYDRFIQPMYQKVCGVEPDVMAIVRDPVDWLGSWYRYRQRPQISGQPNSTAQISFDAFVRAYCQDAPPAFADVGSQAAFLKPKPDGTRVAHLFAYDDWARIETFLAARLGALPQIPRVNSSPKADLTLAPATMDVLREKHCASFDLYVRAKAGAG